MQTKKQSQLDLEEKKKVFWTIANWMTIFSMILQQ